MIATYQNRSALWRRKLARSLEVFSAGWLLNAGGALILDSQGRAQLTGDASDCICCTNNKSNGCPNCSEGVSTMNLSFSGLSFVNINTPENYGGAGFFGWKFTSFSAAIPLNNCNGSIYVPVIMSPPDSIYDGFARVNLVTGYFNHDLASLGILVAASNYLFAEIVDFKLAWQFIPSVEGGAVEFYGDENEHLIMAYQNTPLCSGSATWACTVSAGSIENNLLDAGGSVTASVS